MATKKKTNGEKSAAINLEEVKDTPLSEMTADTFLEALVEGRAVQHLRFWPEKKKYELYIEPENIGRIPFDRFRDILKGEKKKVEYEIPPSGFRDWRREVDLDPRAYDRLVDRLADDIEGRLRERRG